MEHDRIAQIQKRILTYLQGYPDAQDTMKGIMDWWLLQIRLQENTALIQRALDVLTKEGLVLKHQGRDKQIHFRINPKKSEEISTILSEDD